MLVASPLYTDKQRKKLSWWKFSSGDFNLNQIDLNIFHWFYSYEYGNFYQFNSGLNSTNNPISLEESTSEGELNSLHDDTILFNKNDLFTSLSKGKKVFIHNHSFAPSFATGINLQPGTHTNIVVNEHLLKMSQNLIQIVKV